MSRGTPILYIPGIMGSQLYTPEDGKKIWFSPAAVLTDSERLDISSDLAVKNNGIDLQTKKPIQREYGVLKQDILLIEWLCSMFPDTPVYFFSSGKKFIPSRLIHLPIVDVLSNSLIKK